jgi:hypothetical protein
MVDNTKKIVVNLENMDAVHARKITRAIAAVVEASTVDPYKVYVDGFKMTGQGSNIRTKMIEVS